MNKDVQKNIENEILKHDVVSFDIFDTLLIRPYVKPTDVFVHMEKIYNLPDFAHARVKAERTARRLLPDCEDITLDDIYEKINPRYRDCKQLEIDFESKILTPNPNVQKIFEFAQKNKKHIICISDMYLPESVLLNVLKKNGYTINKLYVSSKYKKMKVSGNLFRLAIKDLGVEPNKIIHIGDNRVSDYEIPKQLHMDAIHIKKPLDVFFDNDIRAQDFFEYNENDINHSILGGVLSYIYSLPDISYWKQFGFKYAGPAIYSYMNWLNKQLKQDNVKDVLFIARDGYTLQKVFNIINKDKNTNTAYVYASRIFDVLFNLNYQNKIKQDPLEGISAVKKIINTYKDEDKTLKEETPDNITSCEQGDNFIQSHYSIYKRLAEKRKAGYVKYINQFIKKDSIAVIDTCSIHLSSQRLLSSFIDNKKTKIYGYYFINIDANKVDNSAYNTISFSKAHAFNFVDWDFMEFLITAPEPPISDIKDGKPAYKTNISPYEQKRIDVYPEVSEGAVLFANVLQMFLKDIDWDINAEEITAWINNFCLIPSDYDKPMIQQIKHAYDSQHSIYVPICKPWFQKDIQKEQNKKKPVFTLFNNKLKIITKKENINSKSLYLFNLQFFKRTKEKTILKLLGIPVLSIKRNNHE